MKLVAFLVAVMMVNSCMAVQRRVMLGEFKRAMVEVEVNNKEKRKVGYSENSIDNHHSIPRQYYNDQGGSSKGGDDTGDGANGGG